MEDNMASFKYAVLKDDSGYFVTAYTSAEELQKKAVNTAIVGRELDEDGAYALAENKNSNPKEVS